MASKNYFVIERDGASEKFLDHSAGQTKLFVHIVKKSNFPAKIVYSPYHSVKIFPIEW